MFGHRRRDIPMGKRSVMVRRARTDVQRNWNFSVGELFLDHEIVVLLERYGYTTARQLRNDLSWYDLPELSGEMLDAICQAVHIRPAKLTERFVQSNTARG